VEDAKKFADAICYCNEEIPREFLRRNYEDKWSELQIVEVGLDSSLSSVRRDSQHQTVKKYNCCKCNEGYIIEDLRLMMCNHKYCAKCLKELMKNNTNKSKKRLVCLKCPTELDDEVLRDVDKNLYEKYSFALLKNA